MQRTVFPHCRFPRRTGVTHWWIELQAESKGDGKRVNTLWSSLFIALDRPAFAGGHSFSRLQNLTENGVGDMHIPFDEFKWHPADLVETLDIVNPNWKLKTKLVQNFGEWTKCIMGNVMNVTLKGRCKFDWWTSYMLYGHRLSSWAWSLPRLALCLYIPYNHSSLFSLQNGKIKRPWWRHRLPNRLRSWHCQGIELSLHYRFLQIVSRMVSIQNGWRHNLQKQKLYQHVHWNEVSSVSDSIYARIWWFNGALSQYWAMKGFILQETIQWPLSSCKKYNYVHYSRVRTESWILEKVWKFWNQFSRPGKSLENKDKVWKNGKKSGVFFVLKTETSALLLSEIFQVVKSYLKFCLWRKHSIADREVSDLSHASTASWSLYVHSASWDKLGSRVSGGLYRSNISVFSFHFDNG